MNIWETIREQEAKDRYYEFKESDEFKRRDSLVHIANDLNTSFANIEIEPRANFYDVFYNKVLIGYVYIIDGEFIIRYFKELN